MDAFTLIVAALLSLGGIAFVSYLIWLLFNPLLRSMQGKQDRNRYTRAAEKIPRVDSLIEEGQLKEALRLLRQTPLYDVFEKTELLELTKEHHQNVLSRCVVLAEEMDTHAANLAEVERLVLERTELQLLLLRARDSYASLKSRRERLGKDVPQWSKADFEQRLKEIQTALSNNRATLAAAFEKLFSSIESSPKQDDIVYH
jgi:hypothetical protein